LVLYWCKPAIKKRSIIISRIFGHINLFSILECPLTSLLLSQLIELYLSKK
jgi:hypothetical protein